MDARVRKLQFGLPLLARELIEQAARKRTYAVRAAYAALLFTAGWLLFYDALRGVTNPLAALGSGRRMFEDLMKLQFAGIYLVMPAVACGVITHEKEQNTLPLLFLTKLGPWTILFEKLCSRLVPMFGFLLMSLPLLAYAYSVGGITREHLLAGVWMLGITVLQMAALALFCSVWFRTTLSAFVGAYAGTALLIFGPMVLFIPLSLFFHWARLSELRDSAAVEFLQNQQLIRHSDQVLLPFFTPMHFFDYGWDGMGTWRVGYFIGAARSWPAIAAGSAPILLTTGLFLMLSRVFLIRRAFLLPRNRILGFFRNLDRLFARWNEGRWTKGIVLISDKATFPDGDPVAWRETTKRALGRARYLIRIGMAVEAALITLLILIVIFTDGNPGLAFMVLYFFLWGMAVMIVSVQSASLIAGERAQQTLDVLCTTPLEGRNIILQKYAGVRRLMVMLCVPLLTMNLPQLARPAALLCSLLAMATYLPLAAWLSLWIGLRVKTRARAIVLALATIVGWCLLPIVFIFMPLMMLRQAGDVTSPLNFSIFLSPAMLLAVNEYGDWREFGDSSWPAMVLNFAIYGSLLYFIRRACLVHADRYLGRAAGSPRRAADASPPVAPSLTLVAATPSDASG